MDYYLYFEKKRMRYIYIYSKTSILKKRTSQKNFLKNSSKVFRKKKEKRKSNKTFKIFYYIAQNIHLPKNLKENRRTIAWNLFENNTRDCARVVKTVEIGGNNAGDGKLIGFRGVSGEFDSRLIGYFLLSPVRAWITIEKGRGIFRSPISLDFSPRSR